jgi:hypothetical protein
MAELQSRLEVLLSRSRKRELAEYAAELGLSSSDVARLGISYLVRNPGVLLGHERQQTGAPQ